MAQIPIIGNEGKPILYAYLSEGSLKFEFEYYGGNEDERDYEFVHTVAPEDFASITIKFGLNPKVGILEIIQTITDAGLGEDLAKALRDKVIKNELFVW